MENTPILVDRMKKKGKSWRAKKEMASRYSQKGSRPHRNTRSIYSPVYSSPAVPKRKHHNKGNDNRRDSVVYTPQATRYARCSYYGVIRYAPRCYFSATLCACQSYEVHNYSVPYH